MHTRTRGDKESCRTMMHGKHGEGWTASVSQPSPVSRAARPRKIPMSNIYPGTGKIIRKVKEEFCL